MSDVKNMKLITQVPMCVTEFIRNVPTEWQQMESQNTEH